MPVLVGIGWFDGAGKRSGFASIDLSISYFGRWFRKREDFFFFLKLKSLIAVFALVLNLILQKKNESKPES
jgi:hypothetical protein